MVMGRWSIRFFSYWIMAYYYYYYYFLGINVFIWEAIDLGLCMFAWYFLLFNWPLCWTHTKIIIIKKETLKKRIRDFVHFLAAVRKNYHKSIFLHKQLNLTSRLLHHPAPASASTTIPPTTMTAEAVIFMRNKLTYFLFTSFYLSLLLCCCMCYCSNTFVLLFFLLFAFFNQTTVLTVM